MSKKSIAQRELLFSLKNSSDQKSFFVRIGLPYLLQKENVNFKIDDGAAGCIIEFDGLPENNIEIYGIDSLHALTLAIDIDPYLKGMSKKYNFYWNTGEPYFEENDQDKINF